MKRLFGFLFLVGTVLLSAGLVLAASPAATIFKPGPIKNADLPVNITIPGYYYLTENLTGTSNAITVSCSDVTIDLMGFSIAGPGNLTQYVGINSTGEGNIEVRNGTLKSWGTGFKGIASCRALNLRVIDCQNGIHNELNGLVKDCFCYGLGNGFGIFNINGGVTTGNVVVFFQVGIDGVGTMISNNSVQGCTGNGISGNSATIIGNTVQAQQSNAGGISTGGICLVTQNTVSGTNTPYVSYGSGTVSVNNAPDSPPVIIPDSN